MSDATSDEVSESLSGEQQAWLQLSLVNGVGSRIFRRLIDHFGSAKEVFSATLRQLGDVQHVGPQVAAAIQAARYDSHVERVLDQCTEHNIRILCGDDAQMPPLLQELPDAPVVLYVQGTFTAADQLSIGIVGTRHASAYGRTAAELFGRGLARAGLTIVSGLARGIDTAAHEAALEVGGRTIAFLGSSLTDIYPAENTELAARIAKQGAVASETPPFAKTKPGVFPQRNRLISGMSLGVLIVEAAERSGALITASHAGEQGRDVFAVPGSIQSRTSRGCNKLIRDGAILVQDASDVIEHLGPLFQDTKLQDDRTIRHPGEMLLNDMETCVLQSIQVEPTDIDEITAKSGYNISQVLATISVLHMRKLIRRLSARTVQRI